MRLIFLLIMASAAAAIDISEVHEHPRVTARKEQRARELIEEDSDLMPQDELNADGIHPLVLLRQHLRGIMKLIEDTYLSEKDFNMHGRLLKFAVLKVDEESQDVTTKATIAYDFLIPELRWDPAKYLNIGEIAMKPEELFVPKTGGGCMNRHTTETFLNCTVTSDGHVRIITDVTTEQHCTLNLFWKPYDSHPCETCLIRSGIFHPNNRKFLLSLDEQLIVAFFPNGVDPQDKIKRQLEMAEMNGNSVDFTPNDEPLEWTVSTDVKIESALRRGSTFHWEAKIKYTITRNPAFYNWILVYITIAVCLVVVFILIYNIKKTHVVIPVPLVQLVACICGVVVIFCSAKITGEWNSKDKKMCIFSMTSIVFMGLTVLISVFACECKEKRKQKLNEE